MISACQNELRYNHTKNALRSSYGEITLNKKNTPDWAVHKRNAPNELVHCTVPFVGLKYEDLSPRILVYASAENLSGYYKGNEKEWPGDWLDNDSIAEDRHRNCFMKSSDDFFPNVHIAPMNCGALSLASYYLSLKLRKSEDASMLPAEYYETISFANYAKYSIETPLQRQKRLGFHTPASGANIDYANKKELLKESHPYLESDLKILQPDVVIIPASIYKTDKEFLKSFEHIRFIPIYQINSQVINLYIARKYPQAELKRLPKSIQFWYENLQRGGLSGKTKENYLAVFSYLDALYNKIT